MAVSRQEFVTNWCVPGGSRSNQDIYSTPAEGIPRRLVSTNTRQLRIASSRNSRNAHPLRSTCLPSWNMYRAASSTATVFVVASIVILSTSWRSASKLAFQPETKVPIASTPVTGSMALKVNHALAARRRWTTSGSLSSSSREKVRAADSRSDVDVMSFPDPVLDRRRGRWWVHSPQDPGEPVDAIFEFVADVGFGIGVHLVFLQSMQVIAAVRRRRRRLCGPDCFLTTRRFRCWRSRS